MKDIELVLRGPQVGVGPELEGRKRVCGRAISMAEMTAMATMAVAAVVPTWCLASAPRSARRKRARARANRGTYAVPSS